jgi:hypothetical protein
MRHQPKKKKEKIDWGIFSLGVIATLVGHSCALTGQAGYRAGYATGTHVRVGGAIVALFGLLALYEALKKDKK